MSSFQEQFIEIEDLKQESKIYRFNKLEKIILIETLKKSLSNSNDKDRLVILSLINKFER